MSYEDICKEKIALLRKKSDVNILAIETSCDETACAVVKNGREVLSDFLHTQIPVHELYGGVVPEIASRNHTEKLPYVVNATLKKAGLTFNDIDAYAVTYGPGLVGALLTGVSFAKALAYADNKPLIKVNHIEGHISADYITHKDLQPPFICLVVSGGHTNIIKVADYGKYTVLGSTRDDAAGEAFDKVARVLGLKYPGGPNLQRLAKNGDKNAFKLPRSFRGEDHLDFSFSGLKTAIINLIHNMEQKGEKYKKEDIAAAFQAEVADVLVTNTFKAAKREGLNKIAFAGGVSANEGLRELAYKRAEGKFKLYMPELHFCTDNAAMIASAAYYRLFTDEPAPLTLNAEPSLKLF